MRIPMMLKNRCTNAVCTDGFKYFPSAAKLASKAVVVVPMLLPSVMGYAVSKETSPAPHNGVNVDVNTEDDLTSIVINVPMRIPTYPVSHGTYGISAFIVL